MKVLLPKMRTLLTLRECAPGDVVVLAGEQFAFIGANNPNRTPTAPMYLVTVLKRVGVSATRRGCRR